MSVTAYAALTKRRQLSRPQEPLGELSLLMADESTPTTPPPVGAATIDTLTALVPAEFLVAHATILQVTTSQEDGNFVITQPGVLKFAFWGLVVASVAYYAIVKGATWDRLDFARMLIPAFAFAGWTMIQSNTAFDAAFTMNEALRIVIPVLAGLLLAAAARSLAYEADVTEG